MHEDMLLFFCCGGSDLRYPKREVGITCMSDHAQPIAAMMDPEDSIDACGFGAVWGAVADVEEFFQEIGIDTVPEGSGMWVASARWEDDDVPEEGYDHLKNALIRRPTAEELEPLSRGECPWPGGEVF